MIVAYLPPVDYCRREVGRDQALHLIEKGKTMDKKIERSLFIEGREWYDKINGNSYFSARIWVDGEVVGVLPFQYGYGDQYQYEAGRWLVEEGYLPKDEKRHLSFITRELGVDFYAKKSETKKREMFTVNTYRKVGA